MRSSKVLQRVFQDEMSFATTLLVAFNAVYGDDALYWHPTTILVEIQDDFNVVMPQANVDKLQAAIAIVTSDRFYTSLPDFVDMCNALCGTALNLEMWDIADVQEISWSYVEAAVLWPEVLRVGLAPKILGYIEKALESQGFVKPPEILATLVPAYKLDVDQSMFEEDPELYAGVFQTQQSKASDIDQAVHNNLQELAKQLDAIDALDGEAKDIILQLLKQTDDK